MRASSFVFCILLPFSSFACSSDDDSLDPAATGGSDSSGSGGGTSSTGGRTGSTTEYSDLPGKIRFANFVSDGTQGVDLDFYWGSTLEKGELIGTVEYGEITDFHVPRRANDSVLDADEARYFAVISGDTTSLPTAFPVLWDQQFSETTVLSVLLAGAENLTGDALVVQSQTVREEKLPTPPSGKVDVFGWSSAFDQIQDGDFVLVGSADVCSPTQGDSGGANAGVAYIFSPGTVDLALYDANTEPPCATGSVPVEATLEADHSYIILGEAETFELSARKTVLLEVGMNN